MGVAGIGPDCLRAPHVVEDGSKAVLFIFLALDSKSTFPLHTYLLTFIFVFNTFVAISTFLLKNYAVTPTLVF